MPIRVSVIVHTILGLPKETKNDMLKTMKYIGNLSACGLVWGIKLQLLHILKGTDLGELFLEDKIKYTLTMNDYIDLVITCLEHLPQNLIIHRLTGDGPKKLLLAPDWSGNKRLVLNTLHGKMKEVRFLAGKILQLRRCLMQSDTFMLYKLMILYILSRVDFPLTNAQLTAFILEKEYTNYFNIQRAISELIGR